MGNGPYQFVTEIPIGGEGGWDILTIDSAGRRLYLSHATKVVVVDLEKNAVAGEIADTPGVHGFVPVPALQRGFSSNGKENKTSVVDLKTLATNAKIDTGKNRRDHFVRRKSGICRGRFSGGPRLLQHRGQERSGSDRCSEAGSDWPVAAGAG